MYSITRICDNSLEHSERLMFKMNIINFDYCPICGNKLKPLNESLTNFSNYTGKLQDTIKYFTNIHPRNSKIKRKESINMSINFANQLNNIREKMQDDENPWGIIPDPDDFNNPENEKLVSSVFGSYENECAYLFNILVMDMDQNPGDFAKENDITSAKQFVDILMPVVKNMGYRYRDKK